VPPRYDQTSSGSGHKQGLRQICDSAYMTDLVPLRYVSSFHDKSARRRRRSVDRRHLTCHRRHG
jgi:hypothetical protein